MNVTLVDGHFNAKDTLELVTQLIHVKIRFHEQQIARLDHEEDIKMREKRVKELQRDLFEAKRLLGDGRKIFSLNAVLTIE